MATKLSILFSLVLVFLISPNAYSAEGDTYNFSWLDPDKEVFVLQNRKFRKKGKLHLNLGYGTTTSGAFVDSKSIQGRAGYFFAEEWGVEFLYSSNSGSENDTASSLRNDGSAGSRPFRRIVDSYMGGMVMWSPFYAKINTFNKIIYVDWILGLGMAKLEETNNREEFLLGLDGAALTTETHNGIMWDTGIKFYLDESWEIRTDLTVVHYKAKKASNSSTEELWYANWDAVISLGYRF